MEEIKTWIVCVTSVCLAGNIIRFLLPSGRVSDSVITALRLTTLCVVLIPLFHIKITDSMLEDVFATKTTENIGAVGNEISGVLLEKTENALHTGIGSIVEQFYEGDYDIQTDMDILSDNSIHIKQICITLFGQCEQIPELKQALQAFCSLCEVVTMSEVKMEDE